MIVLLTSWPKGTPLCCCNILTPNPRIEACHIMYYHLGTLKRDLRSYEADPRREARENVTQTAPFNLYLLLLIHSL